MRYAFIAEHRASWPIALQCRVLDVARSGFYTWQRRRPKARAAFQATLTEQIWTVYRNRRQVYGAPRIHQELRAQGQSCNRKTVAKYMRLAGIRARTSRRFRVTTT